ncbi:hypothetical protein [Methylobacterium sp. Leaf100]|uniref:hypothetical protein n=1 Tax=Methylobacterium sp. Leaf100 TaxID=1736252 RepID=UPI0006FF5188|nr:hypothetical protein [Methylobacterium sp. Leaf100]KQP36693.1 hypothetical protein ASF25_01690 [Methylobacterium sp. Leaf100]
MDISATFGLATQGYSALTLTGAARDFSNGRGILSGLRLIDTVSGIFGVEAVTKQVVQFGVKLALRADNASEQAAREMVDLMRSRVPQDSGLLLNGITYRREGKTWVVEATADRDGYDYALAVEAGHRAGGTVADGNLFADTTGAGGRQVRASGPTDVEAQPYFYNSAREALSDWTGELRAASREGL